MSTTSATHHAGCEKRTPAGCMKSIDASFTPSFVDPIRRTGAMPHSIVAVTANQPAPSMVRGFRALVGGAAAGAAGGGATASIVVTSSGRRCVGELGTGHDRGQVGGQRLGLPAQHLAGLAGVADQRVDLGRPEVALVEPHVLLPVEADRVEAELDEVADRVAGAGGEHVVVG